MPASDTVMEEAVEALPSGASAPPGPPGPAADARVVPPAFDVAGFSAAASAPPYSSDAPLEALPAPLKAPAAPKAMDVEETAPAAPPVACAPARSQRAFERGQRLTNLR